MKAKALILVLGAFVLLPAANALDEIDFAMQMVSPQTSTMDVGLDVELMTVYMDPIGDGVFANGKIVHKGWFDGKGVYRQLFATLVGVNIPSKLPGFMSLKEAVNADVRLRIVNEGQDVAECLLAVDPIISRAAVYFSVDLTAAGDDIKPSRGICDVDLQTPGIQVGIPMMHHKDVLKTFVNGKPFGQIQFLQGYCY